MAANKVIIEQLGEIIKRQKTGTFYKVDLHIHTPGSKKDYKVNNQLYEAVDIVDLEKIAKEKGLLDIKEFKTLYKDKDELMALLIIHEAYQVKDLNLMAITDHNNMEWYESIRDAAGKYITKISKVSKQFMILPGVEITCFNGTHVIGIFDNDEYKNKWNYIKYELNGVIQEEKKIFTNKSEMDVIKTINKFNGVVYIPHIDNNAIGIKIKDMLNPLSGASKAQLLTSKYVNAIGFTNYELKEHVQVILEDNNHDYYRSTPVAYLKDSDAHCIDDIGIKFIYIKMHKPNFSSLKFALQDPKIRIREELTEKDDIPYIRGVVVRGGYLAKQNSQLSYYPFSKDLNCIIGGRGTGKSTLIKSLKSCLTGKTPDYKFRLFMGQTELMLVYLYINNVDYCIYFEPKMMLDSYTGKEININGEEIKGEIVNIENWTKVYKVKNGKCIKLSESEKYTLLDNFSVDYFDQSEILEIGKNNESLKNFIDSIIFKSKNKKEYINLIYNLNIVNSNIIKASNIWGNIDATKIKQLTNEADIIKDNIDKIKISIIEKLNDSLQNKVLIEFKRVQHTTAEVLGKSLEHSSFSVNINKFQYSKISRAIDFLSNKYDLFEINTSLNEKDDFLINEVLPNNLFRAETNDEVENDETSIDESIKILSEISIYALKNIYMNKDREEINIKFNVNSHDRNGRNILFKPISVLSLGQRAVVILTIITEGISSLDFKSPLIIDQPEDHLDNRFIYQHLIETIRILKERKQLILVTHNANIPVSGDAENVMYLDSNNENGWLDTYGYLDNYKIQRKIIDSLEGGEESFKLRLSKYLLSI